MNVVLVVVGKRFMGRMFSAGILFQGSARSRCRNGIDSGGGLAWGANRLCSEVCQCFLIRLMFLCEWRMGRALFCQREYGGSVFPWRMLFVVSFLKSLMQERILCGAECLCQVKQPEEVAWNRVKYFWEKHKMYFTFQACINATS